MQDVPGPHANPSSRGIHVQLLQSQRQRFRTLLAYIWRHSTFYRDYYRSHGIQDDHLADLTPSDLPFMTKATLMEHFDQAVTDPRLRKRWYEGGRDSAAGSRLSFVPLEPAEFPEFIEALISSFSHGLEESDAWRLLWSGGRPRGGGKGQVSSGRDEVEAAVREGSDRDRYLCPQP